MEDQDIPVQPPPLLPPPQPERQRPCRYCRQDIHKDANVCQHCRCHQNPLVQYSLTYGLLAVLLAFGFGIFQSCQAWTETIKAAQAAKDAKIATDNANAAAEEARKAQCNLIQTGFEIIVYTNHAVYLFYRIPPGMTEQDRKEIFGRIINLKERLKGEHSKANCPDFPELSSPTKIFGSPIPTQ